MGFSYRQGIGELIYALTICRIDISIAIIILSQHSINLAKIHYEAVKHLLVYLNATEQDRLTHWRTELNKDLPYASDPWIISDESLSQKCELQHALEAVGTCDATWASDHKHRRSMGCRQSSFLSPMDIGGTWNCYGPPDAHSCRQSRYNKNDQLTATNAKNATRRNETFCYITMDRQQVH